MENGMINVKRKLKKTTEDFIKEAKSIHCDKYDYSKTVYNGSSNKVCIICSEHGEFWQTATEHIQGHGCPVCYGNVKKSTAIFIEKARKIHDDKYDYSKVNYINNKTKVCIICPEHGEFWQTPKNHLINKQGCPRCGYMLRGNKLKLSTEQFIEKARKIHGNKYDYSKVNYINSQTKVCIICPEHGEFWQTPKYHLDECGCSKCSMQGGNEKKSTEQFIEKAKKIHGDKYDYSKVNYVNAHTKVCIICPEHGEFWQTPHDHYKTNGCCLCGIEQRKLNRTYTIDEFINISKKIHGDKYDYSKVNYLKSNEKVCIICPEHGEFWQTATEHIQGCHCPKCSKGVSYYEEEIFLYLKKNINNVKERDRKILDGKELDIYLPDYNLAIEYNGLYWHNELYKDKNYHLDKTNLCQKKGIRLIHIFEDEWLYKQDIVKSRLKSILGLTENKIFARKCEIREVNSTEAMNFYDNNHLQGRCKGKYHYGLYYNDELVSLMTFGKTRQQRKYNDDYDNTWELLRFANKLNITVIGGASKLLKHFIKEIKPKEIISYADKRWSDGNLYKKLGFIHEHDSKPNYFYVFGQHRKNRFNFRKGNLVKQGYDPSKSEHEIMSERKIYRIYDCGTMVFKLKF